MGKVPRANTGWCKEEDDELYAGINAGLTIRELAEKHGRTPFAIECQIEKILGYGSVDQVKAGFVEMQAAGLTAQGYRRISGKYRTIARIDDKNWLQKLASKMNLAVADFYNPKGELSMQWADHYRRCLTTDKIENVNPAIFKLIPSSINDSCGFHPKLGEICLQEDMLK